MLLEEIPGDPSHQQAAKAYSVKYVMAMLFKRTTVN